MRSISPSKTLCISYSSNDLSMLDGRHGFLATTVLNADEEVKRAVCACGCYIASKPLSEGVVEILQRLVARGIDPLYGYGLVDADEAAPTSIEARSKSQLDA